MEGIICNITTSSRFSLVLKSSHRPPFNILKLGVRGEKKKKKEVSPRHRYSKQVQFRILLSIPLLVNSISMYETEPETNKLKFSQQLRLVLKRRLCTSHTHTHTPLSLMSHVSHCFPLSLLFCVFSTTPGRHL